MHEIQVTTHEGKTKNYKLIDSQLAAFYFKSFIQALDVQEVVWLDGLTGEIYNLWREGELIIFCGNSIE